jgi:hypothetical protein
MQPAWSLFQQQVAEANAAYVNIGLITKGYIQYTTFGFRPHDFPIVLRHCQYAILAFHILLLIWNFRFSLLSRMTLRYFTWLFSISFVSKSIGAKKPSKFLFFVKSTIDVLSTLTFSPISPHHFLHNLMPFALKHKWYWEVSYLLE